jgi:replicative DNA helicase
MWNSNGDDILRRVPPQNIEAEQSVLGAILLENKAINQALEVLKPDDFYRESHREIFRMMTELSDRNQPVDAITMTDALRTRGKVEAIGGPAYIAELAACVPTAANVAHYARIVREKAVLRAFASTATELANAAYDVPFGVRSFLADAGNRITEVAQLPIGDREKPTQLGNLASEIEPKEVRWVWKNRIPRGKVTIFDGDPGTGKSHLTLALIANITKGWPFHDGASCEIGKATVFSAEDDPHDTIVPRLLAAGADLARVRIVPAAFETEDGPPRLITLPDDLAPIEEAIKKDGASFVVIDPLTAFLSDRINSNKDQDVRRVLAGLSGVAARTSAAIIAIRHLNKSGGSKAIYRGGGSIGIGAAARASFLIAQSKDDETRRIFAPIKSNLGPLSSRLAFRLIRSEGDEAAHVEWIEGEVSETLDDLLREPDEREMAKANKREAAVTFLVELLADGPRPTKEVEAKAAEQDISRRTLARARDTLKIKPQKKGFSGEWFLSLPGRSDDPALISLGAVGGDQQSASPPRDLPKDASGRDGELNFGAVGGDRERQGRQLSEGCHQKDANGLDHLSHSERRTSVKSANYATCDGAPQRQGVQAFERQLRLVEPPASELAEIVGAVEAVFPGVRLVELRRKEPPP